MISAILIDNESICSGNFGSKTFSALPRIGEYIEMETESVAYIYRVEMVIHSAINGGIELLVKKEGKTSSVLSKNHLNALRS